MFALAPAWTITILSAAMTYTRLAFEACINKHQHLDGYAGGCAFLSGRSDVGSDGTRSGWFSDDGNDVATSVGNKFAVDWRTTNFQAGDALALSLDTIHMTAANCTDQIRLSCDTRWQPVRATSENKTRVQFEHLGMDPNLQKHKPERGKPLLST
jgi:hypothetical protein